MLAGSIGGLAGTVAMSQFQEGWRRLSRDYEQQENLLDGTFLEPTDDEGSAEILSRMASLAGVDASDIAIKRGGVALHYVLGVAAGTLYGALHGSRGQELNARTFLKGALFGAALFLAAGKVLKFTLRFSPQRIAARLSQVRTGITRCVWHSNRCDIRRNPSFVVGMAAVASTDVRFLESCEDSALPAQPLLEGRHRNDVKGPSNV